MAVGARGHIVTSGDQGKTWIQADVTVSSDLVAVNFVNSKQGWAVGHDGVVLHSTDGGMKWVKQLDGFQVIKLTKAYQEKLVAAGSPDAALWAAHVARLEADGADKPFFAVHFLNEKDGFVAGAFNTVFRTRDGGNNWEPIYDRTDNSKVFHFYAATVAAGNVYLLGEQGTIRRWNSQQERFEVVNSPYQGSYFGALGTDASLTVFGLRGNAFQTLDNGLSWKKIETQTTASIVSAATLADGRIVFPTMSRELLLVSKDAGSVSKINAVNPMPYFGVAPLASGGLVLVGPSGVRVELLK